MGTTFRAAVLALVAATTSPAQAEVERTLILAAAPAVVEMRAAALIMSGQQGGPLPIAITGIPDGAACGGEGAADCRFAALVEIDGTALLEGTAEGPLPVEVFAYVLGPELDVLDQQTLALDAGLPAYRMLLANTGLKVFLPLAVAPGDHQLRILVQAGEAFGVRGLDLRAGPATPPWIRTPIFHELLGPWLLAAPDGADIPLAPPFGLEAGSPLPAARPQMPSGGSIPAQILISGAGAGDLTAVVRKPGGETVEVPLAIDSRGSAGGPDQVAVSFSAPPGVGPGLWEIAVAGAGDVRSSFVPFFIEPPSLEAVAGAAAGTTAGADRRTPAEPKALSGNQRRLARANRDGYARALRQLATGDTPAAMSTLMASEGAVIEALDADGVDVLRQSESQLLASFPDADWGCLLPVVLLHFELSRAYRENRRDILAHHARRMTIELAEAYAAKLDAPQAAAEAARALASLAGHAQHHGALSQAERLFTRALDVAADDAALLGLGTLYEKRGYFDRALPLFERLVERRPEHAESALRLALNRARTGQIAAARKALGELASGRHGDWVGLLAHQELARLLIDEGQLSQAVDVLRRGLGRWPGHPTLQLQLAWVLDAEGESQASLELLEDLGASGVHPAGERSRYNRWPADLLAAGRRALAESARSRLPALERWLSSQDGGL